MRTIRLRYKGDPRDQGVVFTVGGTRYPLTPGVGHIDVPQGNVALLLAAFPADLEADEPAFVHKVLDIPAPPDPFICAVCGSGFKKESSLKRHVTMMHKEGSDEPNDQG